MRSLALPAAIVALLAACDGGTPAEPPPGPAAVNVTQDSLVVRQQTTGALSATVTDAAGRPLTTAVTWSSSRPDVVAVDAQGGVQPGRPGVAYVVASVGVLRDSARVRVQPVWTRVSVAMGIGSTCALAADGTVFCWGANDQGQLGNGTKQNRATPGVGGGGLSFREVAVGTASACGIDPFGEAYCWGSDLQGELGDGGGPDRATATKVLGGHVFASIVAGYLHFCGLTADGTAWCWGDNEHGQLGINPNGGINSVMATPVQVSGGLRFATLAAGSTHTCGITLAGDSVCWGGNQAGELGTGSRGDDSFQPVAVDAPARFATLSAGVGRTCGADAAGAAWCWGTVSYAVEPLSTSARFSSLAVDQFFACGLTAAGETWCWGTNETGQLGLGPGAPLVVASPTRVPGAPAFARIDTGYRQSCGITAAGDLYCWGDNRLGQLGIGDTADRSTPTRVADPL
jgi:alpha-tubulin suppressor-like RCC1 family protein